MSENQQQYKLCPFCNEEIKVEAVVCKHCKKDIPKEKGLTDTKSIKITKENNNKNLLSCFLVILTVSSIAGGLFNLLPCLGNIAIPIITFIAVIIHNLIIKEMNNRLLNSVGMGVSIGIISTILSTIIFAIVLSTGSTTATAPPLPETNLTQEDMEIMKHVTNTSMLGLGAVFGGLINTILSTISALIAAALVGLIQKK